MWGIIIEQFRVQVLVLVFSLGLTLLGQSSSSVTTCPIFLTTIMPGFFFLVLKLKGDEDRRGV
jgi:hypothetical protein